MNGQMSLFSIDRERSDGHALDDLFQRSLAYRRSDEYMKMLAWVAKFPLYRPFNRLLLYQQNPNATFVATPEHWERDFGRTVKPESRPLVILKPFAPVQFVYDVADTEGASLPSGLVEMFIARGAFSDHIWAHTLANLQRDQIYYREAGLSVVQAGSMLRCQRLASLAVRGAPDWAKYVVTIRQDFARVSKYATLVHELAHLYCGHFGEDPVGEWGDRSSLGSKEMEIEAESVAHLVCTHAGIASNSDKYLSQFADENDTMPMISPSVVVTVAGRIEAMGDKKLPERKQQNRRKNYYG